MKPLLYIALTFLVFSKNINAQSYTERMAMQEDFFMLKISEQEFWTIHRNNIVRYTSEGDTIDNVFVNFPPRYLYTYYAEVIDEQTIRLLAIFGEITDLTEIENYNSLIINSSGAIIDNKIILNAQDENYVNSLPYKGLNAFGNKYLIQLEGYNRVFCFDSGFDLLWNNDYDNSYYLSKGFNERIYLASQNQYIEIDEDGNILSTTPINITNSVEIDDGIFLSADYYSAKIFNNSGVTLYSNEEISRLNYLGRKDSLIILSSSKFFNAVADTDSSFIYILNDQLEVLHTYQFNNPRSMRFVQGLNPGNFIAFENHFISKINQEHKTVGWIESMFSYGLKSFGYDLQEVNHTFDIGIVDIICDDITVQGNMPFYSISSSCQVKVKNFSNDTISKFFISYYGYPGVAHGCYCVSWPIEFINLNPGEEKIIDNIFNLSRQYFSATNYPTSVRYCLCTSTPNRMIDANYSNDCHCETFQVTNIQELEDNFQINIFPNPGNGTYQILDENIGFKYPLLLEVYNMQGAKILHEQINSNSTNFRIDAASGLYLIGLTDEKGNIYRSKLIHKQP